MVPGGGVLGVGLDIAEKKKCRVLPGNRISFPTPRSVTLTIINSVFAIHAFSEGVSVLQLFNSDAIF
jgi:hypothetical protein